MIGRDYVVERGTHRQLLAAGGPPTELYQTQFDQQATAGQQPELAPADGSRLNCSWMGASSRCIGTRDTAIGRKGEVGGPIPSLYRPSRSPVSIC